eukprot:gene17785-24819_t
MDANQVTARLAQTGLSEEEKQAVRDKLAAGSINPNGWNFLNDMDLTSSLRNLVQQVLSSLLPETITQSVNPNRKRRWDEIKPILERVTNESKKKDKSSISFSSLNWEDFTAVFKLRDKNALPFIIPIEFPRLELDRLHGQLCTIHKLFGSILSGKEAKRLQFISPILIAVCSLLPDITISVEEDMRGVYLHANGRFEYVIKYLDKKVCIVEAKKDDMQKGQIQCLMGCEVIAELEKISTVYGIVTNYIEWSFYKSTDDYVLNRYQSFALNNDAPDKASLAFITDLIFGMLTEIHVPHPSGIMD